jgi:hypothetical protein
MHIERLVNLAGDEGHHDASGNESRLGHGSGSVVWLENGHGSGAARCGIIASSAQPNNPGCARNPMKV